MFVAGLVGEGLSRLFVSQGFEAQPVADDIELSYKMGKFLQKTNIIRDYLEDYMDGRAWWPQEVWRKHAPSGELGEFAMPEGRAGALACLNELTTDALELGAECLRYMAQLKDNKVFRFCAIPQVMAIATLGLCFDNGDVFTGVCKVRKGLTVKMIMSCTDMDALNFWFAKIARSIKGRARRDDPSYARTVAACDAIVAAAGGGTKTPFLASPLFFAAVMAPVVAVLAVPVSRLLTR